jgi:hypothetical protein
VNIVSGEESVCATCVQRQGLCARHKVGVLPQLAQPFWYKLVGTHHQQTPHEVMLAQMSPDARRVYDRKRTKEARKAARAVQMTQARERSLASLAA